MRETAEPSTSTDPGGDPADPEAPRTVGYPFTWAPAEQQRHASLDPAPKRGYRPRTTIKTLCDQQVVTAESGEIPWIWPTCPACDDATREIAGVPSRAEIDTQHPAGAAS